MAKKQKTAELDSILGSMTSAERLRYAQKILKREVQSEHRAWRSLESLAMKYMLERQRLGDAKFEVQLTSAFKMRLSAWLRAADVPVVRDSFWSRVLFEEQFTVGERKLGYLRRVAQHIEKQSASSEQPVRFEMLGRYRAHHDGGFWVPLLPLRPGRASGKDVL